MTKSSRKPLTQQEVDQYRQEGFVIKKDLANLDILDDLLRTFIKVLGKYNPDFPPALDSCSSWDDPALVSAVLHFRKTNPKVFGVFYDALQNSSILQAVFTERPLMDAAGMLLGDDAETLSSTGHMLRVDVPEDSRNTLDWHQDSAYYKQNRIGDHGVVVLVPMVDVGPDIGSLMILVGSHREGILEHELRMEGQDSSEKFTIPESILSKYATTNVEAKRGDVVFCQINLIHKSGFNSSKRIRFTTGIRFHKTLGDDFLPGRLIYEPNKAVEQQLEAGSRS